MRKPSKDPGNGKGRHGSSRLLYNNTGNQIKIRANLVFKFSLIPSPIPIAK
jgi:hypothetical protein